MKTAALFCIFLVLTQSMYLRKGFDADASSPIQQLRKVKEINEFAANMISNVELHLQTGGKVDEVISFVRDALADSQSALNDLRNEAEAEDARLGGLVSGYEDEVERLNANFTTTVNTINDLNEDISNLEITVERLTNDLSDLSNREQALTTARDNDVAAYEARQARDANTIQVLNEVMIPALQNLVENGAAFLEKSEKELKFALDRIPTNSIQAFVELTTQFNEAKVRTVIQKLTEVLNSVQTSSQQDYQEEVRTKAKFLAMIAEIDRLREYKGRELSEARSQLEQNRQDLISQTAKRDNLVANIDQTQQIKDATIVIRDNTTASFDAKITDATGAVQALRAALDILTDNESALQQQESATAPVGAE